MDTSTRRKSDARSLRRAVADAYAQCATPGKRTKRFLDLYRRIIRKFSDFLHYREQCQELSLANGFATLETPEDFVRFLLHNAAQPQKTFVARVGELEEELNAALATLM